MTGYCDFEAPIVPMEWGKNSYTILIVPKDVLCQLGQTRRVEGEILDHPINMALTKSPAADGTFLYISKALIKALAIEPGQRVAVRLRPVDAGLVETPSDVTGALTAQGILATWQGLTAGRRRALLHHIDTAKRAETRAKRISHLVAELKGTP